MSHYVPTTRAKLTKPLCVLSIDGGGIRGIIPLLILREIMRHLEGISGKELRPCEVFHLIGGTSAGGLIALMLGRMRMTVDECIANFTTLSEDIFRLPIRTSFLTRSHWYSSENLENVLKTAVGAKTLMQDPHAEPCPTFVVAVQTSNANHSRPILFRTYESRAFDSAPRPGKTRVWEAARATSAAPKFFPPFRLGNQEYMDGGFGHNNPAPSVQLEARLLTTANPPVACMISLGTGLPGTVAFRITGPILLTLCRILKMTTSMTAIITDAEKTHETMRTNATDAEFDYFRFNAVLPSREKFPLDAWRSMGALVERVSGVNGYTSSVDEELLQCAEIVNEFRRNEDSAFPLVQGGVRGDVYHSGVRGPHYIAHRSLDIPEVLRIAAKNSTPMKSAYITPGEVDIRFAAPTRESQAYPTRESQEYQEIFSLEEDLR